MPEELIPFLQEMIAVFLNKFHERDQAKVWRPSVHKTDIPQLAEPWAFVRHSISPMPINVLGSVRLGVCGYSGIYSSEPKITAACAIGSRPVAFQKLNINKAIRSACLALSGSF